MNSFAWHEGVVPSEYLFSTTEKIAELHANKCLKFTEQTCKVEETEEDHECV